MKRFTYLLFTILLSVVVATAQDARFSQYYNAPLTLNPALAGNGIEYIRVSALYRTQWAGMGTPFTTQGLAVDKVVGKVGIGANILRNAAGDGGIRNLHFSGNLSYHLHLGNEKIHTLSAGVQVGIINRSFDESKLTYDNQYNPDVGYDPTLSSNEIYTSTNITRPDVNLGILWQRGWNNKDLVFRPYVGFSLFHITRPPISFIDSDDRMPIKQTYMAGAGLMVSDQFEITPSAMVMRQDMFRETTFGTLFSYAVDKRSTIQAGVYHRVNDAVIAYAGYRINRMSVGMSYDINTGELSRTGKATNAYEFSLGWSPVPRVKKTPKQPENQHPALLAKTLTAIPAIETPATLPLDVPEIVLADRPATEPLAIANNPEENTPVNEAAPVTKTTSPTTEIVPVKVSETAPVVTAAPSEIKPVIKVDSDGDGISDADDICPFIRGTASQNGCPDSDKDGTIDLLDECPYEFGPTGNKGCPDPNIAIISKTQELVKNYNNILFETGKAKVSIDDAFDIIERAIDVLYADKSTNVILSGHTDHEGDGHSNMLLSEGRIAVVKAYMIRQGIDENRISTVAYGETMPASDNHTAEGRKLNRRVEINIVRMK